MKRALLTLLLLVTPSAALADSRTVQQAISAAIDNNPAFGKHDLSIDVRYGRVTLEGDVASNESKLFAEDIARSQKGISEVRNNLKVNPDFASSSASRADSPLSNEVLTALRNDPALVTSTLIVQAKNGAVTLSGDAPNEFARTRAQEVARRVPGVESVTNRLGLRQDLSQEGVVERFRAALRESGLAGAPVEARLQDQTLVLTGDLGSFREIDHVLSIAMMTPGVSKVKSEMTIHGAPYPSARLMGASSAK